MKICPLCKREFPDENRFCGTDGARLMTFKADVNLIGEVIDGRYQVEEFIAKGGMGKIFKVKHLMLGNSFALKLLYKEINDATELQERFRREARSISLIKHPNIVFVTDFGVAEGLGFYFVMEFLVGRVLGKVIDQDFPLALPRIAHIFNQLGEALSLAHGAGIIHRDIKPDNIFLISRGEDNDFVKIVDFGIARLVNEEAITNPGDILGSPEYISPEQARGLPVDHRTDIYSSGILLYEMLVGHVPFKGNSIASTIMMHCDDDPVPPSRIRESIAASVDRVVMKALAKNPQDRYQSILEMASDLQSALEISGTLQNIRITPEIKVPTARSASVKLGAKISIEEPGPLGEEGRRYRARIEVQFLNMEQFNQEFAANLKYGGLFIPTTRVLPPMSWVLLVISLPCSGSVHVTRGMVVQVVRSDGQPVGLGISLEHEDKEKFIAFIESEPLPALARSGSLVLRQGHNEE